MLEKQVQIKELYDLKHRNDKLLNIGYDFENNAIKKSMSNRMLDNPVLNDFLTNYIQKYIVTMSDSVLFIRNMFNPFVNKYYNKHNN